MLNILKKNEKTESKLKNFSGKAQELNEQELKKVMGGDGGPNDPTPDDVQRVKSHSNINNN